MPLMPGIDTSMTTMSTRASSAGVERPRAVAGLGHHFEIRLAVDQQFEALAHGLVVFHQQYPQTGGSPA